MQSQKPMQLDRTLHSIEVYHLITFSIQIFFFDLLIKPQVEGSSPFGPVRERYHTSSRNASLDCGAFLFLFYSPSFIYTHKKDTKLEDTLSIPMGVWGFRLQPQSAFPAKQFKRKSVSCMSVKQYIFKNITGLICLFPLKSVYKHQMCIMHKLKITKMIATIRHSHVPL